MQQVQVTAMPGIDDKAPDFDATIRSLQISRKMALYFSVALFYHSSNL